MDARTTFDREPARTRRGAAAPRVAVWQRPWFRLVGLGLVAGWVGGCIFFALRLVT